jgi:hypothetical protein
MNYAPRFFFLLSHDFVKCYNQPVRMARLEYCICAIAPFPTGRRKRHLYCLACLDCTISNRATQASPPHIHNQPAPTRFGTRLWCKVLALLWTIGRIDFNFAERRATARVALTFHVEAVGCSWGYPGVLYSVWT